MTDPVAFKRSGPSANAPGWVTFNVRAEHADEAERRLRAQPSGFWDDDEGFGETVESFLRERHQSAELDAYLEIGDELTLHRTYTLTETWRISNDVPWTVELASAASEESPGTSPSSSPATP